MKKPINTLLKLIFLIVTLLFTYQFVKRIDRLEDGFECPDCFQPAMVRVY